MSKYYTPTLDDFTLGTVYQVKPNKEDVKVWETRTVTAETFTIENGCCMISEIVHELKQPIKEAKILYRIRLLDSDDWIVRGFNKTTPIFVHNRQYNSFVRKELTIIVTGEDVTIKTKEDKLYEGVIINAGDLDKVLMNLDIDDSINYKVRRKISTAVTVDE